MGTFFRQCFTAKDNVTGDLGRLLWAACFLAFFAFEVRALTTGERFDMATFAGSCVALLTGGAGALRIKSPTEPGNNA